MTPHQGATQLGLARPAPHPSESLHAAGRSTAPVLRSGSMLGVAILALRLQSS